MTSSFIPKNCGFIIPTGRAISSVALTLAKLNQKQSREGKPPLWIPEQRVSGFSKWVMDLTPSRGKDCLFNMLQGIETEKAIFPHFPRPKDYTRELIYNDHSDEWEMIYLGTSENDSAHVFRTKKLTLRGQPLYAKPDVIFRHRMTDEVIILEIKSSPADLPTICWPNVRAQLWAYADIDADFMRVAPKIYLAAEVWNPKINGMYLRKTYTWDAQDEVLHIEAKHAFEIYSGEFENPSLKRFLG